MAISVVKKNVEGKVPTWRGFIADTIADLALLPVFPAVAMGSECYCSEDGNTYILETDGDWVVKKGSSSGGGGGTGGDTIADLVVHVQVYEVYDEEDENITYDIESDKTATEVYDFISENPDKLVVAVVGYGEKWEEDGETGSYIDHTDIYNYCQSNFRSIGYKGFYCYNSFPYVTVENVNTEYLSDYYNRFSFLGMKQDSYDDETGISTYVWSFEIIDKSVSFEQSSAIHIAPQYGTSDYQTYSPANTIYRFMYDVRLGEKFNNLYLVHCYSSDQLYHIDYYRINCFETTNIGDINFLHIQASRQEYVNEDGVYTHILHTVLDGVTQLDAEHLAEPMIFHVTELTSDITTV